MTKKYDIIFYSSNNIMYSLESRYDLDILNKRLNIQSFVHGDSVFETEVCILDAGSIFIELGECKKEKRKEIIKQRANEIKRFLEDGKIIIVLANIPKNYEFFFPFALYYTPTKGNKIESEISELDNFMLKYENYFTYNCTFSRYDENILHIKRNKSKCVGCIRNINKGKLLIMPNFNYIGFIEDYGIDELYEPINKLINLIFPTISCEYPSWAEKYSILNEMDIRHDIYCLTQEKARLVDRINDKSNELNEITSFKRLITSKGNILHKTVSDIFTNIGFNIENPENNLEDIIVMYDNQIIAVEVKGTIKSANMKNVRQLQNWVTDISNRNDLDEDVKGLLLINTFCDKELKDRTDLSFPSNVEAYSKSRNQCLMTGMQLLSIYSSYVQGEINIDDIFTIINGTSGTLNKYNNWEDYIEFK